MKNNDFSNKVKVDNKTAFSVIERKKFLELVKGNRVALNMLSIDRLKILNKYYDELIDDNEKKLKRLRK